ncbi:hypothetical protein SAZ_00845 [Streptomyces noursei ZPM]|nr:hypothetical protein SAZ_00845 [Streptomyces noursei ZPM]EOT01037.1 hypothetical protein K530_25809 [Streptomyces noursei CCRC 11814]EXU91378.1 hypothetical protein P354_05435 [Streptomyces noursei PD-1]
MGESVVWAGVWLGWAGGDALLLVALAAIGVLVRCVGACPVSTGLFRSPRPADASDVLGDPAAAWGELTADPGPRGVALASWLLAGPPLAPHTARASAKLRWSQPHTRARTVCCPWLHTCSPGPSCSCTTSRPARTSASCSLPPRPYQRATVRLRRSSCVGTSVLGGEDLVELAVVAGPLGPAVARDVGADGYV